MLWFLILVGMMLFYLVTSKTKKIKVEKANQLYDAVQQIAACAISLDIFVAIQNPGSSHYWRTTPMMELKEEFGNDLVDFHSCAHGGTRDDLTTIWLSKPWYIDMNRGSQDKSKQRRFFQRLRKLHVRCTL